jgi:hypothetical protein
MGEKRKAYRILVGKLEVKKPLGRPRRRWVDNNKIDLIKLGSDGVDWIDVAEEGSCEHGADPSCSIKCWEVLVAAQLAASQEGFRSVSE